MIRHLAAVLLLLPALQVRAEDPPCLPPGSVPELASNPSHGWLSKSGPAEVKRHLETIAGKKPGDGTLWEGDTLKMSCAIQGPAYQMTAATVTGGGPGPSAVTSGATDFQALAQRSGHTPQEADVLARRYQGLAGRYFRSVPDGQGGQVNEETLIVRRHEKALGITPPTASDMGDAGDLKARAQVIKQKIADAKKRGDTAEMMRLASEAQQLASPAMARAEAVQKRTDAQAWALLESALPELMDASYATRITVGGCPCLRCRMPE
jgi:hypothetical protein